MLFVSGKKKKKSQICKQGIEQTIFVYLRKTCV